jgi:hypothetical protein
LRHLQAHKEKMQKLLFALDFQLNKFQHIETKN